MRVNQGDLYWVTLRDEATQQARIPHPYVVVQDDLFNHSRLKTVVACALSTNLKRVSLPGNVLLKADEGNLPKVSVVEVAKLETLAKAQLGDYIGTLSAQRVTDILAGIAFLQRTFGAD